GGRPAPRPAGPAPPAARGAGRGRPDRSGSGRCGASCPPPPPAPPAGAPRPCGCPRPQDGPRSAPRRTRPPPGPSPGGWRPPPLPSESLGGPASAHGPGSPRYPAGRGGGRRGRSFGTRPPSRPRVRGTVLTWPASPSSFCPPDPFLTPRGACPVLAAGPARPGGPASPLPPAFRPAAGGNLQGQAEEPDEARRVRLAVDRLGLKGGELGVIQAV